MGSAYITDQFGLYFTTFTIVQWADILTRQVYRDIIAGAFNRCSEHRGLRVHAYAIMHNHLHCILSAKEGNLSGIIRDLKSDTAREIFAQVKDGAENRREWLTMVCRHAAGEDGGNEAFRVWRHDNYYEALWRPAFIRQKMDYVHLSPIRAGLVAKPQHWRYSSSMDYLQGRQVSPVHISMLSL